MTDTKEKVPCGAATPQGTAAHAASTHIYNSSFSSACKEGSSSNLLLSQVLENVEFFYRLGADGGISDDFEECLEMPGDALWPQLRRIAQNRQACTAIEFDDPRAMEYLEQITYLCFEAYRKGRLEYQR